MRIKQQRRLLTSLERIHLSVARTGGMYILYYLLLLLLLIFVCLVVVCVVTKYYTPFKQHGIEDCRVLSGAK